MAVQPTPFESALAQQRDGLDSPARQQALDEFLSHGLPHRRVEAWRWTDLRARLRDEKFATLDSETAGEGFAFSEELKALLDKPESSEHAPLVITFGAGQITLPQHKIAGVDVVAEAPHLQRIPHDFTQLVTALAKQQLTITVDNPPSSPVIILWFKAGAGLNAQRVHVEATGGAPTSIIELYDGAAGSAGFCELSYDIAEASNIHRYVVQRGAPDHHMVSTAHVTLEANAQFTQTAIAEGADTVRLETHLDVKQNAEIAMAGASLLADARHADVTNVLRFEQENARADISQKSVLRDKARGIFQGKFYIARGAQKIAADMQANALLLSDDAEIYHKPELEIYADDVECAHGSTAGALDEDAMFYLQQRGLSAAEAQRLLVEAFAQEVYTDVPLELARLLIENSAARFFDGEGA